MKNSIAEVRNFWNAQPCNIHHSKAAVCSRQYFDEVTVRKYAVEPHIPGFAKFEHWRGKSVLEIGCGIGTDASNFASAGAKYTGVDISDKSLDIAKQRFQALQLEGHFYLGNAEELSKVLPPHKFDLVYSFGAIHHTPQPQVVVDEVVGFMHQDSEFRLMLYARNSWKDIMIEAGLDQFEAQAGCPVAHTFTRSQTRRLLRNYQIISLEQTHIFPYVVEDYIRHKYTVQPWFKAMPERMFKALEKRLGWHLLITAKLPC